MSVDAVFLKIVNMSITAGWLILAVILVRFLLKKAPKRIRCALWALVAVRLVCPFSLESALSLIPSSETIPSNIEMMQKPAIDSGITAINEAVNPAITHSFAPDPMASANPLQIVIPVLSIVWIVGMAALLLYALISYIGLQRKVRVSVPIRDGIFACDEVKSPFILGIFKPRIYVPSSMKGETLDCVITHEAAHIRRRDHWWKPLGFLLLTVYWFNPLCWIAYILLCRDIEMACDEKVIRDMDKGSVAAYSQALLDCSFPRRKVAACPLAFGEVGVKERVRSVLHYKKPALWIIAAAVIVCIAVAVCFLTDPKTETSLATPAVYLCEQEGFGGAFTITLNADGTFEYYEGMLSSYIGIGEWKCEGDTLVLIDKGLENDRRIYFTVSGNSLIYDKGRSARFMYVSIPDGTRFNSSLPADGMLSDSSDIVSAVYYEGEREVDLSLDAAAALAAIIDQYPSAPFSVGADDPNQLSACVTLNASDGTYCTVHYQYYSGFSFLHNKEDDYRTIVTKYDAEGNAQKAWRMNFAFDEAFVNWRKQYHLIGAEAVSTAKHNASLREMLSPGYAPDGVWMYQSGDYAVSVSYTFNEDLSVTGTISKDGKTTDFCILYRSLKANENRAVCEFYDCSPEIASTAEGEAHFLFEARIDARNGGMEFRFGEDGAAFFGAKKVRFALAVSE